MSLSFSWRHTATWRFPGCAVARPTNTCAAHRRWDKISSSSRRRASSLSYPPPTAATMAGSASTTSDGGPPPPRPSSSVVLLSPMNQVLLLHRVKTSSSFASAHVFPGGNLDEFHDGDIPGVDSPERHRDGLAYRIGAIRETFEETGILLAKRKDGSGELVNLENVDREAARRRVHDSEERFTDWVDSVGGIPDTDNLIPFTRWITPTNVPKRFTTQMYLYLLPLATGPSCIPSKMLVPTPDGGVEHTAATFAPAQAFLTRAASRDIILFPPQYFLLWILTKFLSETTPEGGGPLHQASQRERLLAYIRRVPAAETARGREHWTSGIGWGDKVMSPHNLLVRQSDQRVVLGLDKPGPELKGSGRGGDWERVALVRFTKRGPMEVEIRRREDALAEEGEAKKKDDAKL